MLTRQGIKKISNMKTFAISFLCSPSKRRKNEESPIEVSFSHSHQTQGTKKKQSVCGTNIRIQGRKQTPISNRLHSRRVSKKTITTLTARHTYAKMMDETVFSSNYQRNTPQGEKHPTSTNPPSNDKQDEEDLRYFRQMMGIDKIK